MDEDFDEHDDYQVSSYYSSQRGDMKQDSQCEIREQDRYLPIANIGTRDCSICFVNFYFISITARIMKKVLPGNAKIAKDAKESIQECVSEFISFITSQLIFFSINNDDIFQS